MDEWRVTVRLGPQPRAARTLVLSQVTEGLRARLGELVEISAGKSELFVYTGSEAAASEAASVALELLTQRGVQPEVMLDRWNPLTVDWDGDLGASSPDDEFADAQRQQRIADDTRRSEASGVPAWTVTAAFSSRHDAIELAGRLRSQGLPAVRRGKSVLLGASNEDVATALMQRVEEQGRMPTVRIERTIVATPPVDYSSSLFL
jgi:hypothetical protein